MAIVAGQRRRSPGWCSPRAPCRRAHVEEPPPAIATDHVVLPPGPGAPGSAASAFDPVEHLGLAGGMSRAFDPQPRSPARSAGPRKSADSRSPPCSRRVPGRAERTSAITEPRASRIVEGVVGAVSWRAGQGRRPRQWRAPADQHLTAALARVSPAAVHRGLGSIQAGAQAAHQAQASPRPAPDSGPGQNRRLSAARLEQVARVAPDLHLVRARPSALTRGTGLVG